MSFPGHPLKAVLLAVVALAAAMSGFSLASSDRNASISAESRRVALAEARAANGSRQPHGAISRARAAGAKRKPGAGAKAPTGAPGLVTSAPAAPEAPAAGPAEAVPETPGSAPESPAPAPVAAEPEPPAAPLPPAAPEEAPAPESPATPIPSPETSPPPTQPPPKTSTPDIDPGVPLEPAPSPSPAGSLVLGVDGGYAGWTSSEVKQRTALGAAVTRHEWDISNPVASEEDQVLAAATEIHTRVLALLGGNDIGEAAHYRDWVVAFVRYYGPGGTFWAEHPQLDASRYAINTIELGNEPYFGEMSPEEYADAVLPALERIDELDLPVKVLLPVYLHGDNLSWLDTLYERIPNLNSLYHALAFHPYWYGHDPAAAGDGGPLERLVTLRERMDELGADAKPIYLTEYGESTADCGEECVSEAEQAAHLSTMIEAIVSHPVWKVGMLSVFQLIDRGTGSSDRELQFGLLRQDGTPKPAYPIVRAAMQLYR